MQPKEDKFSEWALVELFGHQRIVGLVSECSLSGGAFMRVDVPECNGRSAFTRFYGPAAIFSINPISEAVARGLIERYRNEPVSRFDLPQLAEKVVEDDEDEEDDEDDDTRPY
jgi:hypothetical protein